MKQKKLPTKQRARRPTIALQKQVERLSEREKFCLDAYIVNKNKVGAYLYSREKESTASPESLEVMAGKWFRTEPVIAYLQMKGFEIQLIEETVNKGEDEQSVVFGRIAELLDGFTLSEDPKVAIQAAKELGNLYQLKNKPQEVTEDRKHFYLPLRCDDCAVYKYVRDNEINVKPKN